MSDVWGSNPAQLREPARLCSQGSTTSTAVSTVQERELVVGGAVAAVGAALSEAECRIDVGLLAKRDVDGWTVGNTSEGDDIDQCQGPDGASSAELASLRSA